MPAYNDILGPSGVGEGRMLKQMSADPATPPSGRRDIYPKAAGWFDKDAAGTVKQFVSSASGTLALDDLSDVIITAAVLGDYLRFNGTNWVDVTVSQILTDLLTVDGAGSLLDADLLDGQSGAFYLDRLNHTGTEDMDGEDIIDLDEIAFNDHLGAASAAGRLARNGANLSWHDGTTAGNLARHAGDISAGTPSAPAIAADAVTYAKMQNIAANFRVLGNAAGAGSDPQELSASNVLDFFGPSHGDILYRGAAGWSLLAAGVSGFFLKTRGGGADPVWAAVASSEAEANKVLRNERFF